MAKGWTKEQQEKFPESFAVARKRMSESQKGHKGYWLGKKRSTEDCLKIGAGQKGRISPRKGVEVSQATRQRQSESRLKYMASGGMQKHMYNTKPELKMKELLDALGIHYVFQAPVHGFMCDFYIPEKNLVIEVDGEYWHNYPHGTEKDHRKDEVLESKGYHVIRFWAKEVLSMSILSL